MPESKQTFAPQARSFGFSPGSINEEARTVDVTFSTETDQVERWFGVEILDHSPSSVRMGRLNNGAPLLADHDTRSQIGVIESATISENAGQATLRFSKSALGEEIFQDVKDGIRSKVSVGYRVHDIKMESRNGDLETYRVTDWEPFEISIVSVPADDNAGVRAEDIFGKRTAQLSTKIAMSKPQETQARAEDNDVLEARNGDAPAPAADVARSIEPPKQDAAEKRSASPAPSEADIQRIAAQRANDEVERREEIRELGAKFKVDSAEVSKAVRGNVSVDDFKRSILDNLEASHPAFVPAERAVEPMTAERGTKAATLTQWSESAKRALGSRGNVIVIPDYSNQPSIERSYIGSNETKFHRSMAGAVTLADVSKLDVGIGTPIIDETTIHSPEVSVFPVDIISGATVELSVMTGTPTVGFRHANEGSTSKKGTFASKIYQTQVIEEPMQVDIQGVLNASKDPGRVLMAEAMSVSKAVMQHIGAQTWYAGTAQSGADAKAAPGILKQSSTAATHVVDAGGSTAKTSVWFLELGTGSLDHVYGNDTTLNFGADWIEETVESAAGKKLRALVNYISGRVAPRLANKNAAVRIKNVGTDSGKGLTDALLAKGLRQARELGMNPNAIFLTYRSGEQVQVSRTAYHPTGAPVPMPEEYQGIPFYYTNNISNAETV